jgi:hypothetical protein
MVVAEGWHRVQPVVLGLLTGTRVRSDGTRDQQIANKKCTFCMLLWSRLNLSNKQEEEEEDEFDKVVLGDVVIFMVVGITMWKGDLTIIADLRW